MYKPCHIDARRTSALCLQNNQTTFSLTARVCVRTGRTWTRAREHASSWCAAALHYASELQSTRLYSTTSSGFCAGGRAHVPVCAPHVIDRMRDVIAFSIVSKGSKNMQSQCERNQLNNIEALQIARVSHIHHRKYTCRHSGRRTLGDNSFRRASSVAAVSIVCHPSSPTAPRGAARLYQCIRNYVSVLSERAHVHANE